MTNRLFVLFALTFALLLIVGCRNSAKITETGPAASPTPALKRPPATPAPAQVQATPGPPIQVKPPAAFSADQLPAGPVQFTVEGKAGELLFVKATAGPNELLNDSISVLLPGSGSQPLKTMLNDYTGKFLFALPKSGAYQVDFDSGGRKANIDFAFIPHNDPMVSPGILPEQVSIDFGVFAKKGQLAVAPYAQLPDEGYLSSWPTHLAVEGKNFDFRIMTVAGYKQVFHDQRVEALSSAMTSKGEGVKVQDLPYALEERWCAYITSMRREVLAGEGWRGLRWIGGFGGDEKYPRCGLGYLFAGISNDGRYLIILRSDISHPDQKRLMPPSLINGTAPHTWESGDPDKDGPARQQLEKNLNAADPTSFQPNLDQLDAVIRSLKLRQ